VSRVGFTCGRIVTRYQISMLVTSSPVYGNYGRSAAACGRPVALVRSRNSASTTRESLMWLRIHLALLLIIEVMRETCPTGYSFCNWIGRFALGPPSSTLTTVPT
jgi:hypothetical protein